MLLNNNASSAIFAHNHPGGSLSPSKADIECTKKLIQACNTCSIDVIDHIIVADDNYVSLAEKGLIENK